MRGKLEMLVEIFNVRLLRQPPRLPCCSGWRWLARWLMRWLTIADARWLMLADARCPTLSEASADAGWRVG